MLNLEFVIIFILSCIDVKPFFFVLIYRSSYGFHVGGIKHLVLYKGHSVFCEVDLNKDRKRIPVALRQLVDMIFHWSEQYNYKLEIACEMKAEGISIKTISKITKLKANELNKAFVSV
jgi:hypothetical protein